MVEAVAFTLLRAVSAAVCAWVLWMLLRMVLDVAAAARGTVSSMKRHRTWSKVDAQVTATHPDADVRKARVSVSFDLPSTGGAAATLPVSPPVLYAGSEKGPQVCPRETGRGLLSAMSHHPVGGKVAVAFDPADPRRVEHATAVAYGAIALASRAASLVILGPFGLGTAAILLEHVVFR